MLVLDNTLMGVIEIEPKEILVTGLRKELCKKLAKMLHDGFVFNYKEFYAKQAGKGPVEQKSKFADFGNLETKFGQIKKQFVGLKRTIEYISDFLNVAGQKIWREEMKRIIDLAVEKEASRLVGKKYSVANLEAQENAYVPEFKPIDEFDFTFMGRLLRFILISVQDGFFLESTNTWYDKMGNQVFGVRFINFL
jgi:hypothetical protein